MQYLDNRQNVQNRKKNPCGPNLLAQQKGKEALGVASPWASARSVKRQGRLAGWAWRGMRPTRAKQRGERLELLLLVSEEQKQQQGNSGAMQGLGEAGHG